MKSKFARRILFAAILTLAAAPYVKVLWWNSSPDIPEDEIIGHICDHPRPFKLHITNQSYDMTIVDFKIYIDGRLIVNQDMHVFGQHFYKSFPFRICKGQHIMHVSSKKGKAKRVFEFEITDKTDYSSVAFWKKDEAPQGHFSMHLGDGEFWMAAYDKKNKKIHKRT